MEYDYSRLLGDTKVISEKYENAAVFKIGESVMGREILCVKIGGGHKKILAAGAFHALEYITAAFLAKFAEEYARAAQRGEMFFGRDARLLSKNASLFIVPMVNPDGVEIVLHGGDTKPVWQANARGVDINHNFDADWQSVKDAPSPSLYGGEKPVSEPETKALCGFIRRERFDMLLCFHSQGEEIYYDFNGKTAPRSREIADEMARESGYKVGIPEGSACFGGCKDWFINEFGREGFTIEMGRGVNPLPTSMLGEVYEPNARIVLCGMECAVRR